MSAKVALLIYTLFLFAIFALAYLHMLPLEGITFYWFDSIGHFVLYGFWGYFFGNAYPTKFMTIGKYTVSIGIAITVAIAILEECLQEFSPYRSFSLSDMAFSVSGIIAAAICLNIRQKIKSA